MFGSLLIYDSLGLFILRLVIAIIFAYHCLPKLKNSKAMASGMGMSATFVLWLGLVELFGAITMVTGLYAQLGALLLSIVMLGAIYHKIYKWKVPFAAMDKTGWEFDLMLLASNILILFTGSGTIKI